jgi:hypothetical protein
MAKNYDDSSTELGPQSLRSLIINQSLLIKNECKSICNDGPPVSRVVNGTLCLVSVFLYAHEYGKVLWKSSDKEKSPTGEKSKYFDKLN